MLAIKDAELAVSNILHASFMHTHSAVKQPCPRLVIEAPYVHSKVDTSNTSMGLVLCVKQSKAILKLDSIIVCSTMAGNP